MTCKTCNKEIKKEGVVRYEDPVTGTNITKVKSENWERFRNYEHIFDQEAYCEECHDQMMRRS